MTAKSIKIGKILKTGRLGEIRAFFGLNLSSINKAFRDQILEKPCLYAKKLI